MIDFETRKEKNIFNSIIQREDPILTTEQTNIINDISIKNDNQIKNIWNEINNLKYQISNILNQINKTSLGSEDNNINNKENIINNIKTNYLIHEPNILKSIKIQEMKKKFINKLNDKNENSKNVELIQPNLFRQKKIKNG